MEYREVVGAALAEGVARGWGRGLQEGVVNSRGAAPHPPAHPPTGLLYEEKGIAGPAGLPLGVGVVERLSKRTPVFYNYMYAPEDAEVSRAPERGGLRPLTPRCSRQARPQVPAALQQRVQSEGVGLLHRGDAGRGPPYDWELAQGAPSPRRKSGQMGVPPEQAPGGVALL